MKPTILLKGVGILLATDRLNNYLNSLTTFSGADLVATFQNRIIGELQQVTWNITREKGPVYSLGSADPRSFSRNKRAIAGSFIFFNFDRDSLLETLTQDDVWSQISPGAMFTPFGQIIGDVRDVASATGRSSGHAQTKFDRLFSMTELAQRKGNQDGIQGTTVDHLGSNPHFQMEHYPENFDMITQNNIMYADQLPPFDITLTFANEYGATAFSKIYYIDIANDSGGISIDSLVMERPMTWMARRMSPIISGVHTEGLMGSKPFAPK